MTSINVATSTKKTVSRRDAGHAGPRYVDLPRVRGASVAAFEQVFAALEQPVILEDFADLARWEAIHDWTFDRFAEAFGALEISPRVNYPDPDHWWINPFETLSQDFPAFEKMTVRAFLDRARAEGAARSPVYWRNRGHDEAVAKVGLAPFFAGVHYENIVPEGAERHLELLIGSAGTKAGLHQDDRHNFLVHVAGRKHVMLVSPYYTRCVHPFAGLPEKSPVNLDRFEQKYPLLAEATVLVGTIGPGEVLFIPRGWWHTLRALEPTIMLGCFYGEPLAAADMRHMYRQLGPSYRVASSLSFARRFARTSLNMALGRDPVHGLPIWESPGSAAAVRVRHRLVSVGRRLLPGRERRGRERNPFF